MLHPQKALKAIPLSIASSENKTKDASSLVLSDAFGGARLVFVGVGYKKFTNFG